MPCVSLNSISSSRFSVDSSEMFDWNDEELATIIWGEAGENDDHIVPYRGASDHYSTSKEWKQQCHTIKPTEQKTPRDKIDLDSKRLESSSNFDTSKGISTSKFGTDSWAGSSLSNVAKTEQHLIAEAVQLDKEGEIFENSNEGIEQGDFDDYGWASIGSFDDLDRILSDNYTTMFANASLGGGEELWSSARDATNSSIKNFPISSDSPSFTSAVLKTASENLETKTDYAQQNIQSVVTPDYGKTAYPASPGLQSTHAILDHVEHVGGKSKPIEIEQADLDTGKITRTNSFLISENSSTSYETADKVSRQRKILRCGNKLDEKTADKSFQDCNGTKSSPSSALSQKRQLQGPESFPYQHISNQYIAQPMYGSLTYPNPATYLSPHAQPGEFKHQKSFSGYEVCPGDANTSNKSANTSSKCLPMTPQEKIEKLRRRQQLQAMLAIQKQQQQFDHQLSSSSQSNNVCPQESQIHHFERADQEVDGLSTLHSLDPNSSVQQDDFSMVSAAANDSAEDTILYRLQDIISKLDIEVRLCLRDSLFRLAQSAVHRHYGGETSSSNISSKDKHEVVTKEEINSHNRYGRMLDMETETNPIDRTVAHLLFHRPMDLSGKHSGAPETPLSTKLPHELKTEGLVKLSNEYLPDSLKGFPVQGSVDYCPLAKPPYANQFKTTTNVDHSENASNNVPAVGETMKVEASQ